jgi:Barstar (barnase inhibitor)
MKNTLVKVDLGRIVDWPTFHAVFAETLGFPAFYGRNMDAWIDCMTYLDDPVARMTAVHAAPGQVVVLQCAGVKAFAARCPEQYAALVECSAFVNWRRIETGDEPVLALSFYT